MAQHTATERLCDTSLPPASQPLPNRTPTIITHPTNTKRSRRETSHSQKFGNCSNNCCLLRWHSCPNTPGRQHQLFRGTFTARRQASWGLLLAVVLMVVLAVPAMGGSDDTSEVRDGGAVPTPIPEDYFSEQPANASVPEGDIAVMKCKARMAINHCRWYYIEMDKDFYQHSTQSKLVKDFKPSNDLDCSIRFTKVRKVQEGQWLCQARQFMKQTFYNTRPAFLQVVTESDEREYGEGRQEEGDDSRNLSSSEEAILGSQAPPLPFDEPIPSSPTPSAAPTPGTRGGDHHQPPPAPRDWDPTAPTAIPALGPPLHSGPLPPPVSTAGSHPSARPGSSNVPTGLLPQQPSGAESAEDRDMLPSFSTTFDDHIQNTRTGGSALLPCHVDRPVASCAWVMPNNALFVWNDAESSVGRSLSINTPVGVVGPAPPPEYEFVGNRATGNCSLRLHDVTRHDEGNWRCVVGVHSPRHHALHPSLAAHSPPPIVQAKGPLIHLHLLDYGHHYPDHQKPAASTGTNITLIILFLVGLVLFVVGSIIIYCCYKKVWSRADENSKMLNSSNRSDTDPDYAQQWFQGRNLKIVDPNYTDDFKLRHVSPAEYKLRNIEAMNLKNAQVKYSDIDHYNQYLSMSQGGGGPESVRSSASSNTTLSTVVPDPLGRGRSVSFGTPAPSMSPTSPTPMGHHHHHPNQNFNQGHMMMSPNGSIISQSPQADVENIPFYELHGKLQRPVSLYSTGHVYEEIQEKMPYGAIGQQHVMNSQGILVPVQGIQCGPIVTTPVYTNVVEDHDGYLIPNKSAKIVNTPTGDEDPTQYLAMRGDLSEAEQKMLIEMQQQHPHGPPFQGGMNNLSDQNFHPTTHVVQNVDSDPQQQKLAQSRRRSNDSQLSVEQNSSVCDDSGGPDVVTSTPTNDTARNPNINSNSPTKQQMHKSASTTPNSKRQKMPLPSQPKSSSSSSPSKTPANQQPVSSSSKALHQRTTSLPDSANGSKISHAKSPSLVPTPENYDVPRSLGAVPRSVNGSEISLDDIDGTIV